MCKLVTAIIPVYNQVMYVDESIQSVIAQSYPRIQLILIDDASTDGSDLVLRKYEKMPNVTVIRNSVNLDCARTFNRGLELAEGRYCGILAADDTWEPEFVAKSVTVLEKHPEAAFCYCRVNLLSDSGEKKPRLRDRIAHTGDYCGPEFENIVRNLNPITHHATLLRKSCVDEVGGYNVDLTTTHDWDLWIRLSMKYHVAFINEYLANYRVHESNVSRSRSRSGDKERLIIYTLDRLYDRRDLPEGLVRERNEIYARAYLDIAEGYRVIEDYPSTRRCLFKALRFSVNPALVMQYRRLWLSLFLP